MTRCLAVGQVGKRLRAVCVLTLAMLLGAGLASASEVRGRVTFNGFPVPGVTVLATRDGKSFMTASDENGEYRFADLADGAWTLELTMTGFATAQRAVSVAPKVAPEMWELKMLSTEQILSEAKRVKAAPPPEPAPVERASAAKEATASDPEERSSRRRMRQTACW